MGQAQEIGINSLQIQGRDFDFRKVQGGWSLSRAKYPIPFIACPLIIGSTSISKCDACAHAHF